MDSIDTLGDSHISNDEEEADIINFRQDVDDHGDLSRPISRLGFNRPALSADSPKRHENHNLEAIQWSRSLFQSIGISELRLSALKTHSGNASDTDTLNPARSTSDIGENRISTLSNSSEYFESPYGSGVEDTVKYDKVDRKSSSTPPPVSRLSFPFVTTPSPRRNKPSSLRPSQRHKYSCFPSLMSPESAAYPPPSHQRHSYGQHGYSRLALQYLKWFWSVREHERGNSDLHKANTLDGVSPNPSPVQPATIHPSSSVSGCAHLRQTLSPMTVYPRRGDITALRDPYSFHIDRCFAGFSNWTIAKILWMLDLHAAMEKRKMEVDVEDEVSDEESELEMSASAESSDESDSTLVESENESDLSSLRNAILDSTMINDNEGAMEFLSVGYLDNTSGSQSVYNHVSKPQKLDCNNLPWATNWYDRWALLVDVSRGDKDRKHLNFESAAPPIEFVPTTKDDTGPHSIPAGEHKYLAGDELWNSKLGN